MPQTEVLHTTDPTSSKVANAISSLDETEPGKYRVEFKSETIHRPTAKYIVTDIGYGAGGRRTLTFVGKRENGAKFTVSSNPSGHPKIRNHYERSADKVEDLEELVILETRENLFDLAMSWLSS
jgi:hypothetical protein